MTQLCPVSPLPPLRPEYFTTLRECMLEALAEHLGTENFTEAVEAAWGAAFDAITAVILGNYPRGNESGMVYPSGLGSEEFGF